MIKKTKKPITKKEPPKDLVVYGKARLEANVKVGMTKVDPMDIRPPTILLTQKSSDMSQFVDFSGKQAKVGQFFHTGKSKIYNTFKCYFLFAAKSKYIDRRKPDEGEKDQYRALGVLAEDLSLFAMVFRSSSLFTLSPLFGAAASMRRPMFSFLCEIETKKLSGEKGDWFIPVLRIKGPVNDPQKLMMLEEQAKAFDIKADEISKQDLSDLDKEIDKENPNGPLPFEERG